MVLPRPNGRRDRAATLVETAIVLLMTLTILFGIVILGLGVSYQQMVGDLAREATRAASVRGGQFRQDAGMAAGAPSDWAADIYDAATGQARFPSQTNRVNLADLGVSPSRVTYTFTWSNGQGGNPDNWAVWLDDSGNLHGNTVTVRVQYVWLGITLASMSKLQIAN